MTIQITRPEIETLIKERLRSDEFKDAEDLILDARKATGAKPAAAEETRIQAIERLRTFGRIMACGLAL